MDLPSGNHHPCHVGVSAVSAHIFFNVQFYFETVFLEVTLVSHSFVASQWLLTNCAQTHLVYNASTPCYRIGVWFGECTPIWAVFKFAKFLLSAEPSQVSTS